MNITYEIVDLSTLSLSKLVALYNAHADKPVKAFKDRATALTRCEKISEGYALTATELPEGVVYAFETAEQREERLAGRSENEALGDAEFDADDSGAQTHAIVQCAPEVSARRRGPAPAFADDDVIALDVNANPKRAGTAAHARFALYREGQTVAEYLDACVALQGGSRPKYRSDVIWDTARGFVSAYTARQWANHLAGRDIEDDGAAQ